MKKLSPVLLILAAACGGEPPLIEPIDPPVVIAQEHPAVAKARRELVTVLDLHTTVISRSCSPTGGVCHNGKEYPDLRTTGSLIASLSKPCNRDRFDEPEAIFDGCEQQGDELWIAGSTEFKTKVGYLGPEEYDDQRATTYRRLRFADAAPKRYDRVSARIVRNGETLVNLPANVFVEDGATQGRILDTYSLDYASIRAMEQVRAGDPNGNGVYGAEQPWELIAPGHPDRSYLIGRITGLVPGTRMPLANHPLMDHEYVAIVCWIETMSADPDAHDRIDYNGCNFAKRPISYQIGLAQ